MSLQTAVANISTAASAAIDFVKADATKADQAKAGLLATVQSEIGAEAIGIAAFFQREEAKASAWEGRHLKLLNIIALVGWLVAGLLVFFRLHG